MRWMAIAAKECSDPCSHEPVPVFPRADQFPVCHLGNHIFQQQASRKTSSDVNSQWVEKKKNKKEVKHAQSFEAWEADQKRQKKIKRFGICFASTNAARSVYSL